MERRKFLQLIGVGIVATAARLTTGGDGGNEEQPALPEPKKPQGGYLVPDKFSKYLKPKIQRFGREIRMTSEAMEDAYLIDTSEYVLRESKHYRFTDDQELWSLKRRQSSWQGPLPPGFVILKPSKEMVEELKDLKATEISILARYTDD